MTVEIREVRHDVKQYNPDNPLRPTIIKWKGVSMIRSHSIMATVKELIQASESQDVVEVNIIGDPSSGKTVLGELIQHLFHKMNKIPFSIRKFGKEDLLTFQETLKTLQPANYVLLFDDLSFLGAIANKKQIEMIKQAKTEIRHLEGGQDVKIVIIKVFHYTLGLDKYLRQNDFTYFTSVGSSEDENMEKIVGAKNMPKVRYFKKMKTKIKIAPEIHKKFTYQLGSKGTFTYSYRKPFQPELFWNGDTLRNIVSPTRQWVDPICSVCADFSSKEKFESEIDVSKFVEQSADSYGESILRLAAKNILRENGINTHSPKVVSAERLIRKAMMSKRITLNDLAKELDLTPTKTKMRKDVDLILEKAKKETILPESTKIDISSNGLDADIKLEENNEP